MIRLALVLALAGAPAENVAIPAQSAVLKTLRPQHPRLVVLPEDVARTKQLVATDPRARAIHEKLKARAEKLMSAAPIEHKLIGPRLLGESRKCLDRVYLLATLYRLDGDKQAAERARKEMLVAAGFKDWNPSHFLDTAEMTHALAIGYDWLYDYLSPADRATIREAIINKGLREAEKVYRKRQWWSQTRFNWNQVCNGGIAIGALAIADEEPELAAYIVHQAANSIRLAMAEYEPDGAWEEGPGYWNYATRYNVAFLAALESALGTDFGLSTYPGFAKNGDFRIHIVGPLKQTFNFADGHESAGTAAQMLWLARKYDKPLYAWHEREFIGGESPEHLWWFDPRGEAPTTEPLDRWFRRADIVTLRSAWNDRRAIYVGFKGGDNKANHSQLELGTFVLDANGQRWAVDLGSDDYNLPAYFGNLRWTYYRLATEGQNTLLVGGKNQNPKAVAPIVAFRSTPQRAAAVADLSQAYAGQAKQVRRGMALVDRRQVLVQDELQGVTTGPITWNMHTRAAIALSGNRAELSLDGEKLTARILEPAGAVFTVESATPPPPQAQQPDVRKLVVKLPPQEKATIAVLLTPAGPAAPAEVKVEPLESWAGE
ncbi:MAG: heparinase II/III domain-containing protein [Pirellulales bacterium]